MLRHILRAKLHRLAVTDRRIDYEGSITIDKALLAAADIAAGEKVQVVDINNGARFETYVIEGRQGSGEVCINGGAARLVEAGDLIIVIAYGIVEEKELKAHKPKLVLVDSKNRIK
jgi:aspartate 1-decarboxylase